MYCSECGAASKPGDRFCHNCGATMAASSRPRRGASAAATPPSKEKSGKRYRWIVAAAMAFAVLAVPSGVLAFVINWEPEPVFGGVSAPRYDASLAAGGLSSDQIGTEAVLNSLEKIQPPGYEILADASDEGAIDEFAEIPAEGRWDSAYRLNGGDHVFRFDADPDGPEDEFVLETKPFGSKSTADDLFAVARRYGFLSQEVRSAERALENRLTTLLQTVRDRQFYAGETEPDIAAEAATLAGDWNGWLENYGEYPPSARLLEVRIELLHELEAVASSGSRGFDRFTDLIEELNDARRAYSRSLD